MDVDTFFVLEAIADAIASALLATGRRPQQVAAAWIDTISRWAETVGDPAGSEFGWQAHTLAALSVGDFEYAFRQVATSNVAGPVARSHWIDGYPSRNRGIDQAFTRARRLSGSATLRR